MFASMMNNPNMMRNLYGQQNPNAFNPYGSMFPGISPQMNQSQSQQVQPEILYREQLSKLNTMGFTDAEKNIAALVATGGNVNAAIDRILNSNT